MSKPTDSTVDLSEFEAVSPQKLTCFFSRLDAAQQEKVKAAKSAGYSHPTISKVLSGWDIKVSSSTVGRHFGRECTCGDAA